MSVKCRAKCLESDLIVNFPPTRFVFGNEFVIVDGTGMAANRETSCQQIVEDWTMIDDSLGALAQLADSMTDVTRFASLISRDYASV